MTLLLGWGILFFFQGMTLWIRAPMCHFSLSWVSMQWSNVIFLSLSLSLSLSAFRAHKFNLLLAPSKSCLVGPAGSLFWLAMENGVVVFIKWSSRNSFFLFGHTNNMRRAHMKDNVNMSSHVCASRHHGDKEHFSPDESSKQAEQQTEKPLCHMGFSSSSSTSSWLLMEVPHDKES